MKLEYENTCYVLLRVNAICPLADHRHDFIWYPETSMTLLGTIQYKPFVKSIVTENPWLIAMYSLNNVRIWSNKYNEKKFEWIKPNRQTYGASVNMIMSSILEINQTMPSAALDGGERIQELIKKVQESY